MRFLNTFLTKIIYSTQKMTPLNRLFEQFHFLRANKQLLDMRLLNLQPLDTQLLDTQLLDTQLLKTSHEHVQQKNMCVSEVTNIYCSKVINMSGSLG
jgi:hypothetical protein